MSTELKHCPCCPHGKGRMRTSHDEDGLLWVWIECDGCKLRTAGNWVRPENDCPQFRQERRDEWNRRQPQSAERALLREVTETWPHQFDTTRCKRFRGDGLCDCGADQLNARRDELVARINLLIGPPTDAQGKRDE